MSKHGDSVIRETTGPMQGHRPQTGRFRIGIRKYKKSVIIGCAAVAAALVVLPAAARTWHGMWTNDAETGALVATVDPDGPAAGAGLQRGDIIVRVDGAAVENHRDFLEAISDNAVDDTLGLELRRGNERVLPLRDRRRERPRPLSRAADRARRRRRISGGDLRRSARTPWTRVPWPGRGTGRLAPRHAPSAESGQGAAAEHGGDGRRLNLAARPDLPPARGWRPLPAPSPVSFPRHPCLNGERATHHETADTGRTARLRHSAGRVRGRQPAGHPFPARRARAQPVAGAVRGGTDRLRTVPDRRPGRGRRRGGRFAHRPHCPRSHLRRRRPRRADPHWRRAAEHRSAAPATGPGSLRIRPGAAHPHALPPPLAAGQPARPRRRPPRRAAPGRPRVRAPGDGCDRLLPHRPPAARRPGRQPLSDRGGGGRRRRADAQQRALPPPPRCPAPARGTGRSGAPR